MNLLLLGATGLVGRHVLNQALQREEVSQIIAPTRRRLPAHPHLINPYADDLNAVLNDTTQHDFDAVICALGTTISKAGSKAAFRHADYELPIQFAKMAHEHGAKAFALVSSPGASLSVPLFYSRIKGEVERDIRKIGFDSLTIVRPGMIGGHRDEFRLAERLVSPIATALESILPRWLHINPATHIAQALLDAVVFQSPGERLLTSKNLVDYPN